MLACRAAAALLRLRCSNLGRWSGSCWRQVEKQAATGSSGHDDTDPLEARAKEGQGCLGGTPHH